ncbi:MAG TPA: tetratricopeptide repeat protein [Rhizomicrobium sp.]|nr:tetratricopeptide repeat protein [Rhizomicrobium sp.]
MAGTSNARDSEQALALAEALSGQGRHAEAGALVRRVLALDPRSGRARHLNGLVLARTGRFAQAVTELEEAIALDPGSAAAQGDLGNVLSALGRTQEAIARFETALAIAPDRAETENDLGVALASAGREFEAVAHFERAATLAPRFAPAQKNLANAYAATGRHEQAATHFGKLLELEPGLVAAHCGLGYALQMSDRPDEALVAYENALALDPHCADAYRGRGFSRQSLGDLQGARADFETALGLAPGVPAHHRALAESKTFGPDDPQLAKMRALAAGMDGFARTQQIELHFALAKAAQDLGRQGEALEHLLAGNALKRRSTEYDEDATLTMFRHIAEVFSAELLAHARGAGDPSDRPVFILGMPRSGSTLVEQILASHPKVFGGGELPYLNSIAKSFRGADVRAYFPEVAKHLSPARWRELGGGYLEKLDARAPAGFARVTDKMPANFRYIGLIRMALPNARIVHTLRDPVDTCMSCFGKLFAGSQPYAYDLGELGRYYRAYRRLMDHWRSALPRGAMLEIRYEDLVGDLETGARRIVEYCGLEWDPRCLNFHETARPVRTASVTQVRQPIYGAAIGRWKPYEMMLRPLMDELSIEKM